MFEKELEEYKNQPKWKGKIFMKDEEICFKDGAEFGYNKANEWHDLRKDHNDLPKEDCEIITLHENGNKNIQKWKNGNWTNAIVIPVIAWCEISTFTEWRKS